MRKYEYESYSSSLDNSASSNSNLRKILEIIMLILELILSGKSEGEAIKAASHRYGMPEAEVRNFWKKRKHR